MTFTPEQTIWPTPTPRPTLVPAPPPFTLGGAETGYTLAEEIVSGYNWVNANDGYDLFMTVLVVVVVIGGLYSIVRRVQRLP